MTASLFDIGPAGFGLFVHVQARFGRFDPSRLSLRQIAGGKLPAVICQQLSAGGCLPAGDNRQAVTAARPDQAGSATFVVGLVVGGMGWPFLYSRPGHGPAGQANLITIYEGDCRMSVEAIERVIALWEVGQITTEQAIGKILRLLQEHHRRLLKLEATPKRPEQ